MLLKKADIPSFIKKIQKEQKTLVFTNGCFDLIHIGHIEYLKDAKNLGDVLIVGINSDASVKRLKGKLRPVQNENDRAKIIEALRMVDAVIIFTEDTAESLISLIKPHIYVKGNDYQIENLPEREIVTSYGGKIVLVPYLKGHSTTNLVQKILFLATKETHKS